MTMFTMEQKKIQPQIRITAEGFNTLDHCHELARKIGPNTALYLSLLIKHGKKEKIMIDGCYAVLRLARVYDQRSIEAGCKRALTGGRYTYGTLHSIMVTGTYQLDPSPDTSNTNFNDEVHDNLRGAHFFNTENNV